MAEFALCLSGGGYRAAMFHLGVMTYLNEIRSTDGSRLLDHVHTITSISGGALPGLLYVVGEKKERTELILLRHYIGSCKIIILVKNW